MLEKCRCMHSDVISLYRWREAAWNVLALCDRMVCGIYFLLENLHKAIINASSVKFGTTSRWTARVAAQVQADVRFFHFLSSFVYSAPRKFMSVTENGGLSFTLIFGNGGCSGALLGGPHTRQHITNVRVTTFPASRITGTQYWCLPRVIVVLRPDCLRYSCARRLISVATWCFFFGKSNGNLVSSLTGALCILPHFMRSSSSMNSHSCFTIDRLCNPDFRCLYSERKCLSVYKRFVYFLHVVILAVIVHCYAFLQFSHDNLQ